MVITMLNQKGGVSKTTLAISLAARWHLSNYKVALIDADPQRSIMLWREAQDKEQSKLAGIDVFEAEHASDLDDVRELEGYDYIILDTPGTDKHVSRTALNASDVAIIPVKPSALDIRASLASLSLAQSSETPAAYIITQMINRSDLGQEAMQALIKTNAVVVKKFMKQYTAYVRSIGRGEVPQTMFPGSSAAQNMESIGQAIENVFGWSK